MIGPGPTVADRPPNLPVGRPLDPLHPIAAAELPTRFGDFRVVAFAGDPEGKEHLALVRGDVRGASPVPVRVHSECLTGDVLGSLRCDCRDQLIASLEAIGRLPLGVLLYMRQEGRGIGLNNKIRAYALQDLGHDTIEANHLLGFDDDPRDYRTAAQMLLALGVGCVELMTNNPAKIRGLREQGIQVAGRIPIVIPPNRHNARYLDTKRRRAGHWLFPAAPADAGDTLSARAHDADLLDPPSRSARASRPSRRIGPCPNSM
jgi:GTP cyclohydrolase II